MPVEIEKRPDALSPDGAPLPTIHYTRGLLVQPTLVTGANSGIGKTTAPPYPGLATGG
jgi:hypothetical protein